MKLFINGEEKTFPSAMTVQDVMQDLGAYDQKAAVAVNGEFVPKGQHGEVVLADCDVLEILTPMQGG